MYYGQAWAKGIATCFAFGRFRRNVSVLLQRKCVRCWCRERVTKVAPFGKLPASDGRPGDRFSLVYGTENDFYLLAVVDPIHSGIY